MVSYGQRARDLVSIVAILLTCAVVAGCGSSAAQSAPAATVAPYTPPTPLPTDTPVSEYTQYLAWRSGMVGMVGGVKSAYRQLGRAVIQIEQGNGLNAEGDMQNAQDSIRNAQIQYQSLQPPSNFAHINWVMGRALDTYLNGITLLLGGIGNGDTTDIQSGLTQLRQGNHDLLEIRALESQRQWLQWLDGNRKKPPQQQSGTA